MWIGTGGTSTCWCPQGTQFSKSISSKVPSTKVCESVQIAFSLCISPWLALLILPPQINWISVCESSKLWRNKLDNLTTNMTRQKCAPPPPGATLRRSYLTSAPPLPPCSGWWGTWGGGARAAAPPTAPCSSRATMRWPCRGRGPNASPSTAHKQEGGGQIIT
jgi:hypothetical protein